MENSIKLCLIAMMLFSISCSDETLNDSIPSSQDLDNFSRSNNSSSDVINEITHKIVGTSILHRKKDRITVNFKTTDLTPGYTYTLWWVIWNNPQECAVPGACIDTDFGNAAAVGVDVLYATGLLANNSGIGNFSASLNVDDDSESMNAIFGLPLAGGLQSGNTNSAEVHLVIRSHGPAIPGMVDDQIGGFFGGCSTFFDPFTEIPDAEGECGDIEAAIHSPVN
jgi:hypothetical protein